MNSNDTDQLEAQLQNLFIKASPTCDPVYFAYQAIQLIAQHDTAYREGLLEALPSQSKYKTPDSYKKAVRTLIATYGKDQPKREGTE